MQTRTFDVRYAAPKLSDMFLQLYDNNLGGIWKLLLLRAYLHLWLFGTSLTRVIIELEVEAKHLNEKVDCAMAVCFFNKRLFL